MTGRRARGEGVSRKGMKLSARVRCGLGEAAFPSPKLLGLGIQISVRLVKPLRGRDGVWLHELAGQPQSSHRPARRSSGILRPVSGVSAGQYSFTATRRRNLGLATECQMSQDDFPDPASGFVSPTSWWSPTRTGPVTSTIGVRAKGAGGTRPGHHEDRQQAGSSSTWAVARPMTSRR